MMERTQHMEYAQKGLDTPEVERLKAEGKTNVQPESKTKSVSQIIRDNTCTLFNLLNVILAIMVISVGSYKNALFINIIVMNTVIGIVQEIRAKRTVDKISLLSEPKAHVIRCGHLDTIALEEIVLGDLVELKAGNQIPADAILVSGEMEVDESLLTGEADAIMKKSGDTVLSGSFVVSGTARVQVIRVGKDNYATKLAEDVRTLRKPNSDIMRALKRITQFVGIIIVPVGIALLFLSLQVQGLDIQQSVTTTVAALVGMIPEGLVLLTSIALAVGVIRLSRYRTLVQELYCIETLARVDVLCLDKTGTITEGSMELKTMDVLGDSQETSRALKALIANLSDDNPTFVALQKSLKGKAPDWKATQIVPFSSARKYSGVSFEDHGSYVMGAPEFVLKERYAEVKERVEAQAALGYRVLVLCHSDLAFNGDAGLPEGLTVMALLVIGDKIRPEARETLEYFADQGVEIKVISGDNPVTVSEVAHRAGLNGYAHFVDASTLSDEAAVAKAATEYTVFGRVSPEQKKVLVDALKAEGHTVAMTGDGVNDVLALRDADCSIAMASGSDATKQVAQLVLLDSNFASLTQVLAEGRRVINNITRASSLFLVKTGFSLILALLVILSNDLYPFVPIQLTLISTVTIGIPSFFLALEPNHAIVSGGFLQNVLRKALPGALTDALTIGVVVWIGGLMHFSSAQISSIATILCGTVGLVILYAVCQPLDKKRIVLFLGMVFLFVLALCFFPWFFSIMPVPEMSLPMLLVLVPLMLLTYPVMLLMRLFVGWLDQWYGKNKKNRKIFQRNDKSA
ncbi:cation-transporting ATPase E [Eubacterium aggregans]|uniref:Cation-transporting ATPase E n=1 Tax=Eubacterium aggregans TaxID=81409 RepID=A0A1H3YC31_9FIRM|nr:cation-translocating P-type ATPase [Eubacterium aggregans]SEA08502.1 cation-transporting ATPase E [Eubacterium aggregans]